MEKLRLRKDTTILGQSIASKGEFKDKQAHLRLNLTFIQSHMCPLKCRVCKFITLLQAKAKQTHPETRITHATHMELLSHKG